MKCKNKAQSGAFLVASQAKSLFDGCLSEAARLSSRNGFAIRRSLERQLRYFVISIILIVESVARSKSTNTLCMKIPDAQMLYKYLIEI